MPTSQGGPFPATKTSAEISAFQDEHIIAGSLFQRPVHYCANLDPYIVMSADSSAVGFFTRVEEHASVVLHNYERAVIILRLDDIT